MIQMIRRTPTPVTALHRSFVNTPQDAVRVAMHRRSGALARGRKLGRSDGHGCPGTTKDRTGRVRFKADDLKAMEAAANANKQSISEWVRSTIPANL
jgi:hypothetical protein